MPKTVAIIQARMTSSRLPGKVLQDIAGKPMLFRVVERVCRSQKIDQVVVATTIDPTDDAIALLCRERDYPCFRGSLHDVLDRYYEAASQFQAGVIVRITADCPLIDPQLIDLTIAAFQGETPTEVILASSTSLSSIPHSLSPYDFAANRLPPPWQRTFPIGLDTEVCSFHALERAWKEATQKYQREHVMPYLYDDMGLDLQNPSRFRVVKVDWPVDYGNLRWTVDTPEDLDLIRVIYSRFSGREDFSWLEVLDLVQKEPELAKRNAKVHPKTLTEVDERSVQGKTVK